MSTRPSVAEVISPSPSRDPSCATYSNRVGKPAMRIRCKARKTRSTPGQWARASLKRSFQVLPWLCRNDWKVSRSFLHRARSMFSTSVRMVRSLSDTMASTWLDSRSTPAHLANSTSFKERAGNNFPISH